jgi:hypothetical protein
MTTTSRIEDSPNRNAASVTQGGQGRAKSAVGTITSAPGLIATSFVTAVFWTCRGRIADPDLWWHLRNAQYLVTTLRLPNVDVYSYTTAGAHWIDHEWLSELFYYGAYRSLDLRGVFFLFAAALAALVVAEFWLCLKENGNPWAATFAAFLGYLLQLVAFGPRTQTFGWLCFAAVFAVLLRFRSVRRAPLWLLPPIFCLWINLHASWVLGMAVYTIFLVAGLIRHDIGRLAADPWSKSELKELALAGLASVAALFANPYGYRLVLFPIARIFNDVVVPAGGGIEEFGPVNFQDGRGKLVALVLGLIFVMAIAGRKRWRIDNALLTAFVLYGGLVHLRLLFLAGIVLPPVLAPQFGQIGLFPGRRPPRILNWAWLAIVLGALVFSFPSADDLQAQIAEFFPVRAVDYLRANPQPGNIFNLYKWGGYLEWNLPEVRTFIDGRGDQVDSRGVPLDRFRDYMQVEALQNPEEVFNRFKVSYVLFPANTPLVYYLSNSPQWECIYSDYQAVIYRIAQP